MTDEAGLGFSSSVDLIINVKDTNDNSPVFDLQATFDLDGSARLGHRVGQIEARDDDVSEPNNRLIYILKSGGYGKFSVEYETGGPNTLKSVMTNQTVILNQYFTLSSTFCR